MSYPDFDDMAESTLYPYIHDEIDPDMLDQAWGDSCDDSMDGDHDSAMDSVGWGDDDSLAYGGGCCGEDY